MDFSECTMNFNYMTNSMNHTMRQYFHRTSVKFI
jgi:hypothetical protein